MNVVEENFDVGDAETHDTEEQQLMLCEATLENFTHRVEPPVEDSTEMLTHVGGSTLFPELCEYAADEVFDETPAQIVVWSEDIPDDVVTYVGGMPLLLELGLDSGAELFTERPSKNMVWDDELADSVLTHTGGLSLSIEHDMATPQQFQESIGIDKKKYQGLGVSGLFLFTTCTQDAISVCSSKSGNISHTIKKMKATATFFFHVDHLLVTWLSRTWDPGSSTFASWVLDNNIFAKNTIVSFMNWLLYLYILEDGKSTFLEFEVYIQWDPGIIENALLAAMFVQLVQKSIDLLLLYIQVIKELCNYTMAGHTSDYSMHNVQIDSIVWLGGQGLVAELGAVWEITNN